MAPIEVEEVEEAAPPQLEFRVLHQEVELNVDFSTASLSGRTEITIEPLTKELKAIRLNCRQISLKSITVDGVLASSFEYHDPYDDLTLGRSYSVHQHHLIYGKLQNNLMSPPKGELVIPLPKKVKITELSVPDQKGGDDGDVTYNTITVVIYYSVKQSRDAIHWVGLSEDDARYPHVYTRNQPLPGETANYVFPCVDSLSARSTWKVLIRCPRTLGDIVKKSRQYSGGQTTNGDDALVNGYHANGNASGRDSNHLTDSHVFERSLTEEDQALELSVVCSGYMEDNDAPGDHDPADRKWIFTCSSPVAPQHIGFAIAPFEVVDLSDFRESDQDEKLGQNAVRVHGFCLPGRAEEVRYTCMPVAMALDYFTFNYGSYPFEMETSSYKMVFVDDLVEDVTDTATLSICSTRLLVPVHVRDNVNDIVRELVRGAATQWLGVNIVPKTPNDFWIVLGGSYFMADDFMQTLWGRNEHRFRQKMNAIKVVRLDVKRPSMYNLGPFAGLDRSNLEFLKLKAPLVFFILNSRLVKASGSKGVNRIFWRLLLDAKVGKIDNNEIDTDRFLRICDRVGHAKLDTFFQQWVYGAGCPSFHVTQKFNKKKLVVETTIFQTQTDQKLDEPLQSKHFMRDIKEAEENVRPGGVQNLFTGPMTIRIHEADGTPYEHIVEIKEARTVVEIPYNTKYKRLKRTKRQKERAITNQAANSAGDEETDSLVYCLGDVLQTQEEMAEWRLIDWDEMTENNMNNESYEWIRLDKDFEWICELSFNQPAYMYLSQLQQDNDVVAQVDTLQFMLRQQPFSIISTICIRTLMDSRYFYGIRVLAADLLARCATESLDWIGLFHLEKAFQELFCFPDSPMTRSNDFSDHRAYAVQCAIPRALAKVRDRRGQAPEAVKQFFMDKLKFNDNSNNQYSDAAYVATLMSGLADTLITQNDGVTMSFDFATDDDEIKAIDFQKAAIEEIERHRRIDEWIPSWNNILTVTALNCLERLVEGKVAPRRLTDFIPYTRPENSDPVRLQAFDSIVSLGSLTDPTISRWVLYSLRASPSPYFREQLIRIIGRGLGDAAFRGPNSTPQSVPTGLVIEGGGVESRALAIERTTTLAGALKSLKDQLGRDEALQQSILEVLQSPTLSWNDFLELLAVCRILYDTIDSLMVVCKLPRYWQLKHEGNATLRFTRTGRYRTKPGPKFDPKLLKRPRPSPPPSNRTDVPEPKRLKVSDSPNAKRAKPDSAPSHSVLTTALSSQVEVEKPPITTSPAPSTASHAIPLPVAQPAPIRPSVSRASTIEKAKPAKRSRVVTLKLTNKAALAEVEARATASPSSTTEAPLSQPKSPKVSSPTTIKSETSSTISLSVRPPATEPSLSAPPPADSQSPPIKIKIRLGGLGGK